MIGQTIAHYRILEQLGQGGMGIVYKAEDTRLRRAVALKFLPENLRHDTTAREQFLREARAASKLKHPNVLTIYTVEESSEGDFIAMEYAEAGTLRDRVGSLPIQDAIDFMRQAADALHAAHEHGIIHRDIKPDNLLIDAQGHVRISDFGLARIASELSGAFQSDVAVGTAHYMSPEQVTGSSVDRRSDIFSLGVTFFELIAGRRPFEGDYVMSVLYAIANDPAPRLSDFDPSIPAQLDLIISKCLAKNQSDRFTSCLELIHELSRLRDERHGAVAVRQKEAGNLGSSTPEVRPLIGRSSELSAIRRRLDAAREGTGYTVFLTGESGVGKTRLAEAVMDVGRQAQMGVLVGRCLPQGGGLPFHPYASALRNGLPRLNEALIGPLEKRASALGFELRNRIPVLKSFLNMSGSTAVINQEQLWDSLLILLRVICAERPVILFLDDLQWADDDTLRFFGYVSRNAPELPLVQIATYRAIDGAETSVSSSTNLSAMLRQLHADGFADLIEVQRLTSSDTVKLAGELLGRPIEDPEIAEAIARRTDGNPLYVHEMIQLIRQRNDPTDISGGVRAVVPGRIRDIVAQRIEKLTDGDREMLEFAACETEFFDSEILTECLKMERIPLLRNLQRLEASHRLIRHDGSRYRFDHPLIRDVIYEGILPELRGEYHRLIADVLVSRFRDSLEHASRIAHHLLSSGQKGSSMMYLLRAAERARDLCANSEAVRLYRVLESILAEGHTLSPEEELRFAMGYGDTLLAKGMIGEAQSNYNRGRNLAVRQAHIPATIDFDCRLSAPYRVLGDLDNARAVAQRAVDAARLAEDAKRLTESLSALAMVHVPRAEYDQTVAHASEVLLLAEKSSDIHYQSIALSLIGAAYLHKGLYRQAAEHLERAIEMQRSTGDQRGLASSLNFSGLAYHRMTQFSRSVSHHQESLRIKRAIQDVSAIPGSLNALGDVYRDMGQLDLALQHHTDSLAMSRQHSNRGAECDNLRDLGVDYMLLGKNREAMESLEQVIELAKEHKYPWYETRAYSSLADLCLLIQDVPRAENSSLRALEKARQINAAELLADALAARARVLATDNANVSEAISCVHRAIELATAGGLALPLRAMQVTLAKLLEQNGDRTGSRAAHRAARDLLHQAALSIEDPAMREQFLRTPGALEILNTSA